MLCRFQSEWYVDPTEYPALYLDEKVVRQKPVKIYNIYFYIYNKWIIYSSLTISFSPCHTLKILKQSVSPFSFFLHTPLRVFFLAKNCPHHAKVSHTKIKCIDFIVTENEMIDGNKFSSKTGNSLIIHCLNNVLKRCASFRQPFNTFLL